VQVPFKRPASAALRCAAGLFSFHRSAIRQLPLESQPATL